MPATSRPLTSCRCKHDKSQPNGQELEALSEDIPDANTQVRESLNWGNETSRKSSIFKGQRGKIYHAVIREGCPAYQTTFPKSCKKPKRQAQIFSAGFSLLIAAGLSSNHNPKSWRPLFRVVRRFVALLRPGWQPYTSERLRRGVGACVDRCCEERFCPLKLQDQRRKAPEGWEIAQPPGDTFCP